MNLSRLFFELIEVVSQLYLQQFCNREYHAIFVILTVFEDVFAYLPGIDLLVKLGQEVVCSRSLFGSAVATHQ